MYWRQPSNRNQIPFWKRNHSSGNSYGNNQRSSFASDALGGIVGSVNRVYTQLSSAANAMQLISHLSPVLASHQQIQQSQAQAATLNALGLGGLAPTPLTLGTIPPALTNTLAEGLLGAAASRLQLNSRLRSPKPISIAALNNAWNVPPPSRPYAPKFQLYATTSMP